MSDFDIGECFLNFVLDESLQSLAGLNLTSFFGKGKVLWERWVRAAFGIQSSPYQAFQAILVAKEYILGNRKDAKNIFRWNHVQMNLPGSRDYDPRLPWVSKIRIEDGLIATDLVIYIDDDRVSGKNKDETDEATRVAMSRLQRLGIQDAPRKRRWASRRPGAWAGSIVETRDDGVYVTVSDEKWEKLQRYIGEMLTELSKHLNPSAGSLSMSHGPIPPRSLT
jgi:hypothetical protein